MFSTKLLLIKVVRESFSVCFKQYARHRKKERKRAPNKHLTSDLFIYRKCRARWVARFRILWLAVICKCNLSYDIL